MILSASLSILLHCVSLDHKNILLEGQDFHGLCIFGNLIKEFGPITDSQRRDPSPGTMDAASGAPSDPSDAEYPELEAKRSDDEAQDLVGVSISRAQTRLANPTTSAAERSDILSEEDRLLDLFRHGIPDAGAPSFGGVVTSRSEKPWVDDTATVDKDPRPMREEATTQHLRLGDPVEPDKAGLRLSLPELNLKRFVESFNLPSVPKAPYLKDFSLPSIYSRFGGGPTDTNSLERSRLSTSTQRRPVSDDHTAFPQPPDRQSRTESGKSHGKVEASSPLHKSTSDQSLSLRHVTSTTSSFGDDSKWDHIHDQVNSRFKAVKDTWQDTNLIKVPKLSSMSLAGLRPDFLRARASSDPWRTKRPLLPVVKPLASFQSSRNSKDPPTPDIAAQNHPSTSNAHSSHLYLSQALSEITGDLVILGGYRGSILRSAKPPHRQLWVPMKVGLNIRKVDLEVRLSPEDEESMHNTIIPGGMLAHIGPVDMGRRLLRKLRHCQNAREGRLRVHEYSYDWRLSPHLLSRRLLAFLESLPCNGYGTPANERGAFIVAHSLGGLITRHAINQRPQLFAGVVYAGVPQHCINILGPLRNDDKVMLSSKVLTAQVTFSFRTTFLLLPENGQCFIDKNTKEPYQVDFFNVEHWQKYALSPCIAPTLPTHVAEKKSLLENVTSNLPSVPMSFKKAFSTEPAGPPSATGTHQQSNHPLLAPATSSQPQAPVSTIPLPLAIDYLKRTLSSLLEFKHEMEHLPSLSQHHQNLYPPLAILYGTSVPTVSAAKVANRDAIRCNDAYDDLQFGSGDGVCLARAAMLPRGYECAEGGKVRTEKGHVGLLGDLDGVGKCLLAVVRARRKGVGLGEVEIKA